MAPEVAGRARQGDECAFLLLSRVVHVQLARTSSFYEGTLAESADCLHDVVTQLIDLDWNQPETREMNLSELIRVALGRCHTTGSRKRPAEN
jgi:hypothetical protein